MTPANEGEVVGELVPPGLSMAGQKNSTAEEPIPLHVQSRPATIVGVHVELVPVPLHARFVHRPSAELVKP